MIETVAPLAPTLFIVNGFGIVHREGATCPKATESRRRLTVSPNQCLVFKLPPCSYCWPSVDRFREAVGLMKHGH